MSVLTSITIIISVLIIGITNIISGYFKPEVILDKRHKVYKLFNIKLKRLIDKLDIDIRFDSETTNISKKDILNELEDLNKIVDKL